MYYRNLSKMLHVCMYMRWTLVAAGGCIFWCFWLEKNTPTAPINMVVLVLWLFACNDSIVACTLSCHVPALSGYNSACLCCPIIVVGVWDFRPSKEALLFHSCQLLWSYVSSGADCWQGSLRYPRQPGDDKICFHWQADEVDLPILSPHPLTSVYVLLPHPLTSIYSLSP